MDRISGLSRDIIGNILSRMPLADATRTSILSRTWRYMWTSCPTIILGRHCYEDNFRNKPRQYYVDSVNMILSLHFGPILRFILYIPRFDDSNMSPDVDRWIRIILSRNALEELNIYSEFGNLYHITKDVFSYSQLKALLLYNYHLAPPRRCAGFSNLTVLAIGDIYISPNVFEVFLPSARVLKILKVEDCHGRVDLRVDTPSLHTLYVRSKRYTIFSFGLFGSTPNLEYVTVLGRDTLDNAEHGNAANLSKFLSSMPKVSSMGVSGSNLKSLASGGVPQSLPTPINLTELEIYELQLKDLDQISAVFCLLRNSPSLSSFWMSCTNDRPPVVSHDSEIVEYLQSRTTLQHHLEKMEFIELSEFQVSRVGLLFIKLLLSRTPWLQEMKIRLLPGTDVDAAVSFSAQVFRLPVTSTIPAEELIFIYLYIDPDPEPLPDPNPDPPQSQLVQQD